MITVVVGGNQQRTDAMLMEARSKVFALSQALGVADVDRDKDRHSYWMTENARFKLNFFFLTT